MKRNQEIGTLICEEKEILLGGYLFFFFLENLSSKKNVIFKSAADDDVPFPTRCRSALWGLLVLLVHLLIPFFNYLS